MSDVASIPDYADDRRRVAKELYISSKHTNVGHIAKRVGAPVEEVYRWKDEDQWLLARAANAQDKNAVRLAEINALLKAANRKGPKDAALHTLGICDDTAEMVRLLVNRSTETSSATPEYLERLMATLHQIERLRKDAYARLG